MLLEYPTFAALRFLLAMGKWALPIATSLDQKVFLAQIIALIFRGAMLVAFIYRVHLVTRVGPPTVLSGIPTYLIPIVVKLTGVISHLQVGGSYRNAYQLCVCREVIVGNQYIHLVKL